MDNFRQEVRAFQSERAAIFFILKLRERWGRQAKCVLKSESACWHLRFKVPMDKRPLPSGGTPVGAPKIRMNVSNWS